MMKIYGKAGPVFKAIKDICQKSPNVTLKEAEQSVLQPTNLQNTKQFEFGKYPYVHLYRGYEKN